MYVCVCIYVYIYIYVYDGIYDENKNKGDYRRDPSFDAAFFLQNVFCTVAAQFFLIGGGGDVYTFLTLRPHHKAVNILSLLYCLYFI